MSIHKVCCRVLLIIAIILISYNVVSSQSLYFETEHFIITYSNKVPLEEIQVIGLLADDIYSKIGAVIGFYPDDKVRIHCYSSQEEFVRETGYPKFVGGVFDAKSRSIILQNPKLLRLHGVSVQILTHEYTHLLLSKITNANVPYWFAEGISIILSAQLYSPNKSMNVSSLDAMDRLLKNPGLTKEMREDLYSKCRLIAMYFLKYYSMTDVKYILHNLSKGLSIGDSIERVIKVPYKKFERHILMQIN